uniref:Radial spoke protein 3 n=1 Tax=Chlamydomonas leiostraca TaxID=1034604 RepID=A0A7S0RTI5_9CHLO|mmetsp:Transcript_30639/g.78216  ORF Transcript_30639/g.78216 Transcript_30639/m.78216 type:complete len:521 (+) Transcript_30639:250-1812(+)|eukprot:CAMPEP_0202861288 /NCGR_PEP_ID=MMETSP1391-20130828/2741_1 /ASSEMBLY_ACC=CAM_ASM_000867 /TAXON_ID=1034604 /ORGANISM="Chlamydomonas leiostraca, Strain SAG 11-49" /LENGTH=520 /DNA_ID=CAMNT_0049540655 /DNA_START=250 /DNA_END=1812 /DNA_ORIENTATION=-
MVTAQAQQQLYTHAAEPKAVQQRAKYREDDGASYSANIMFDRRVVRGNTYAARILPADVSLTDKKSTGTGKKRTTRQAPPRTPEPVDGRRHIDIQTDAYLEELTDTVPEVDNHTQTDAFLDRPPTPLFIPQKTGVDAVTQIENGDLFDFDFEVEPILEVLVGKVLEQGLMEVLEEEELAAMRAHQEHFEQIRNAELVATQRMEAAEKRKMEEKERRLAQERERADRERVVRQKVAASTFARGYLSGIVNTVFGRLQTTGFFYDPLLKEVEEAFMPWLKEQAVAYLEQGVVARQVVKRLVEDASAALATTRAEAAARAEAEAQAQAEWEAKQAALKAEAEAKELEEVKARATFILADLKPAVATEEQITAVRDELTAAAQAEADAAYEAAKAAASETARAEAEAKAADQAARLEELKAAKAEEAAAAAAAAAEAGEEAPAEPAEPEEVKLDEEMVDVEAEVAKAVEAVVKPEPKEVTDGDVLSAMLDKAVITKDAIVQALAIHALGEKAFTQDPLFAPPPQ